MHSFIQPLSRHWHQSTICGTCFESKRLTKGLAVVAVSLATIACSTVPKTALKTADENLAIAKEVIAPETKETDPDSQMWLEADTTYADQDFSDSLYAEILEEDSYCLWTGTCGDVQYLFRDVLMVATVGEFGSTKTSLIPLQLISKSQALSYARILDTDSVIDFEDSMIMDNSEGDRTQPIMVTESYFEADLPAEGVAYELASARTAQIISDQAGKIIEVSYRVDVF